MTIKSHREAIPDPGNLRAYIKSQPKLAEYLEHTRKHLPFPRHFKSLEKESLELVANLWREHEFVWEHVQKSDEETPQELAFDAIGHLSNTLYLCEQMMGLLVYSFHLHYHAMKSGDSLRHIEKEFKDMEGEFKTHKPIWDFLDHKLADEVAREKRGKENPAIT